MRAIGIPAAGNLDAIGPVEIEPPPVGDGQIAVRVIASAVNPADLKVLRAELTGRVLHARTKPLVSGYDFSGTIEACGAGVTDVKVGDEVFGHLPYSAGNRQGAFAERVVVPRSEVGRKPAAISHELAAASPTPGLTALQSLRDVGRLTAGGHALVTGAAGGVGSIAIGVAHLLGAKVTGVCSTYAMDFVRELGADDIVDRRARDPSTLEGPYDVILDAAAAYSYASMRHALAPAGTFVTTLPSGRWALGKLMSVASKRRCKLFVVHSRAADLEQLGAWLAGGLKVPIDARFPVRDLRAALDRYTRGELKGRIAIAVENGF